MRRTGFCLGRVLAEKQAYPVVERGHIRHADNEMAADLQRACQFVKYLEQFLGILDYLAAEDQVQAVVGKRQAFRFNVAGVNEDPAFP